MAYRHQRWRSRGPASVSRPASRPNFSGLSLGLGLSCPCLGLGLGLRSHRLVYKVSRTGLGLETGLKTYFGGLGLGYPCLGLGGPGLDYNPDYQSYKTMPFATNFNKALLLWQTTKIL